MEKTNKHSFEPIVALNIFGKGLNVYGTISKPVFITWDIGELLNHQDYDNSISAQNVADSQIMDGSYLYRGEYQQVKVLTEDGLTMFMYHSSNPEAVKYLEEIRFKIKEARVIANEYVYTDNAEAIANLLAENKELKDLLEAERQRNAEILQEQVQLKKDYIQLNTENIQLQERVKMLLENIDWLNDTANDIWFDMTEEAKIKNASSLSKRGGFDA